MIILVLLLQLHPFLLLAIRGTITSVTTSLSNLAPLATSTILTVSFMSSAITGINDVVTLSVVTERVFIISSEIVPVWISVIVVYVSKKPLLPLLVYPAILFPPPHFQLVENFDDAAFVEAAVVSYGPKHDFKRHSRCDVRSSFVANYLPFSFLRLSKFFVPTGAVFPVLVSPSFVSKCSLVLFSSFVVETSAVARLVHEWFPLLVLFVKATIVRFVPPLVEHVSIVVDTNCVSPQQDVKRLYHWSNALCSLVNVGASY